MKSAVMMGDMMSICFHAAELVDIRYGDTVAAMHYSWCWQFFLYLDKKKLLKIGFKDGCGNSNKTI